MPLSRPSYSIGDTLMDLGQRLPELGQSIDTAATNRRKLSLAEQEQARQNELLEIQKKNEGLKLADAERMNGGRATAQKQLGAYNEGLMQAVKNMAPGQESINSNTSNIGPVKPVNRFELGQQTGLAQAANYDPAAKGEWDTVVKDEEARRAEQCRSALETQKTAFDEKQLAETIRHNKAVEGKTTGGSGAGLLADTDQIAEQLRMDPRVSKIINNYAWGVYSFPQMQTMLRGQMGSKVNATSTRFAVESLASEFNPNHNPQQQAINTQILEGAGGRQLLTQRAAAHRMLQTLEESKDAETGQYKNVPEWLYGDIALDYAKLLVPSGSPGVEMMKEIKQRSLHGDYQGAINYVFGNQGTTPPDKVLALLHERAKQLSTTLDAQYTNIAQGVFQGGDPSVGDVRPTVTTKLKIGDVRKGKSGDYEYLGGDEKDKKNWRKL
jgi:hypothetical protein